MLRGVRVGTLDDAIQLSDGILKELDTLNLGELSAAARKVLFIFEETTAAIKHRVEKFFTRWQMVNTRLERMDADVFRKQIESTERYNQDSALTRTNYEILRDAHVMLMAIKIFLDGEQGYQELARRQQLAAAENETARRENRAVDFLIIIAADRYKKYVDRLERRATALLQMLVSAYQMSLAITQMADQENVIRQELSDIRTDLLPMWKINIVVAYQAYQQHGIMRFMDQLRDAEEDIRMKTADQIEQSARDIAATQSRPFDVGVARYCNDKLINSLEILKTASAEARKQRQAAEASGSELIRQLGEAAASVAASNG